MNYDNIHKPGDGRGPRVVYLNGKKIDDVFFADTKKGIVDVYVKKNGEYVLTDGGDEILSERKKGEVKVKEISGVW